MSNEFEDLSMNVTKAHLQQFNINGGDLVNHCFDMTTWGYEAHCGTAACLWGTMFLLANDRITRCAPPILWYTQSPWHEAMNKLFYGTDANTYVVLLCANSIDDDGVMQLAGQDLQHKDFSDIRGLDINLRGADLRKAHMSGMCATGDIDLRGADLRGAILFCCKAENILMDEKTITDETTVMNDYTNEYVVRS